MESRYQQWDGSQDPFGPDLDVAEILDEISDDVLAGDGAAEALHRLMRRGLPGRLGGLDELRRRVAARRRQASRQLNLDGPLGQLSEQLEEILAEERRELGTRSDPDARMRESLLDALPNSPTRALQELMDYRFVDPSAQEHFDQLVENLRGQVMDANFRNITGGLGSMSAADVARVREMLSELNAMIEARDRGEDYDFAAFMQRYDDLFPDHPRTLDELLDNMARRMAAMSRLLASLSPEQRRQLQELTEALLADWDLAFQMDQLAGELRALAPHLPWDQATGMPGSGPGEGQGEADLPGAVGALEELGELEELEEALGGDYAGASIEDVDEEALRRALGEEAVSDLRHLRQIEKVLEEAGVVTRSKGQLEVSARGARRLGERALVAVFERLHAERAGGHEAPETGGAAEPTGATRPWHFGDSGEIAVQKTMFNAVLRSSGVPRSGLRPAVRLRPEDFELVEAESRSRTATALLLDLSFSMPLGGHWIPAKRMALALHALIEGKYPQDILYLIGFSDYARRLQPTDLTSSAPFERVHGTNMQHAFLLARRLLAEHPRASKQVIMVTDGEPTAHLMDGGPNRRPEAFFSWPPTRETITKTLAEGMHLAASGATLNVFMLEDSPGLVAFMEKLGRLTSGRVFRMDSQDVGRFVLSDYVRRRA